MEAPVPPAPGVRDACWPDGVVPGAVVLNDVSRLNATAVGEVVQVHCIGDVQAALARARAAGRRVSVRGTKHSMGGHSLVPDGVVIDMGFIRHAEYHAETATVTAGAGATWADLIRTLNAHGKTPRTLQSYCTFSIGGTLAVNGHGITSDHCVAESVVRLTVVRGDGAVVVAERAGEHAELFRHVLGGYGLFGVVFDVELRVDDNVRLALDVMSVPVADVPHVYDAVLAAGDVEMKLARLDTTTMESAEIYVFRRDAATPTVSALGAKPREMTAAGRLMYKWLAGPMREARFAVERQLGVALDWADVSDRNEMLFESAAPLARLYSPLVALDDTFVLQEYFVPRERFADFAGRARAAVVDGINRERDVTLLNITLRFVLPDATTALPYARHPAGVFAFVLYFRLRRTPAADAVLRRHHAVLTAAALAAGGTFYLPYRHHYTDAELGEAYPGFAAFCAAQARLEPTGVFGNLWFDRYRVASPPPTPPPPPTTTMTTRADAPPGDVGDDAARRPAAPPPALPPLLPAVRGRRTGSFRALLGDAGQRGAFVDVFLVEIFNLLPAREVHRMLSAAAWDARNGTDADVYAALCRALSARASPLSALSGLWAGVKQASDQKRELVREVVSVLARLGRVGAVHAYVSIGDAGKLVLPLRRALGMTGAAWVVHDADAGPDDAAAVVERGAATGAEVGAFVRIDYHDVGRRPLGAVPDGAADLVTLCQGLHHFVPGQVPALLADVARVLRPGGVFLLREHALDEGGRLVPTLDCAHSVFNAITGVPPEAEAQELRCFRPLAHWRAIVGAAGLDDARVCEMQPDDPTLDVMLAFVKPPRAGGDGGGAGAGGAASTTAANVAAAPPPPPPAAAAGSLAPVQLLLNNVPTLVADAGTGALEAALSALPQARAWLRAAIATDLPDTPGLRDAATALVDRYLDPALTMLQRFRPLAAGMTRVDDFAADVVPPELFLLGPAVRARADAGGAVEKVLVSLLDRLGAVAAAVSARGAGGAGDDAGAGDDDLPAGGLVSDAEVAALADELLAALPALAADPDGCVRRAGLPPKVEAAVSSRVAAGTAADAVRAALRGVDRAAWGDLRAAVRAACAARAPPTLPAVLSPASPWHAAAVAVLGSPGVAPTRLQRAFASGAGLGPLVKLWETAQRARRAGAARGPAAAPAVDDALAGVCPVVSATYTLDGGAGAAPALPGVLAVLSATYEVRSLTGLLADKATDVTAEVAAALDAATGVLALGAVALPGTRRLGARTLHVTFRSAPTAGAAAGAPGAALAAALAAGGHIDGAARAANAVNNAFKLPEWLQVELLQSLAASLNHTPWYRWPFMDNLGAYWRVLGQQVRAVAGRHGWADTLASTGFVTDFVPGVVMAALFGQLALLAYPLRAVTGADNWADAEVEELVVAAPRGVEWAALDARVAGAREVAGGLYVMTVPTFKPLTEVLTAFARRLPAAVLLLVSNHSRVAVKVLCPPPAGSHEAAATHARLVAHPGCTAEFEFVLPPDGGAPPRAQVALRVATVQLLALLRYCARNDLAATVYDFN